MFIGRLNILFSEAPALCIQYVLDSILFLDVCILSIIIQPVACHLTLFLVSLDGQEFFFFKTSNNFIKKNKINICYSTQQPF